MARRTVITGANRGLGLELARGCAAAGDAVWAGCRRPEDAAALGALEGVTVLPLDVVDPASIAAFAAAVGDKAGAVDLLVNNAGVNGTAFGAPADGRGVLDLDPEVFRAEMDVNALGPLLVTRALLPRLRAAAGGIVVNVSSQLGALSLGQGMLTDVGYNASKAALNMITVALAGTLEADGIAVVALHPGWVRTDMGGPEAPLSAEESARAILETVAGLRPEHSGRFVNWDGTPHPW
jgi:NAD(P)-dependent dehydrogenase (short-subunit alcohol dehydrogenase family)